MTDSVAQYIDHAVLHPTQTDRDVVTACNLCRQHSVASICVKPYALPIATKVLKGSGVKVGTVIGYPHGGTSGIIKAAEAEWACSKGAEELDVVINIGDALSENFLRIESELSLVIDRAKQAGAVVKVILETGLISSNKIKRELCKLCESAGADFVKTSTGFGFVKTDDGNIVATGATEHDVELMREFCSKKVGVKASGGIRTLEEVQLFLELGATRIGTSSTELILAEEAELNSEI